MRTTRSERKFFDHEVAVGPVPSRRLGRILGINNIPPKTCNYSCRYCQLGRTSVRQLDRCEYYKPTEIVLSVQDRLAELLERNEPVDYLMFFSEGEPTLDQNLGGEIIGLRSLGVPLAVITNASLVTREDVRGDLGWADLVSLKVDAVDPRIWRTINRPHRDLDHHQILTGAEIFARRYHGTLVIETMLVKNVNDDEEHVKELAAYLESLSPSKVYLTVPIRPPACRGVHPPDEHSVIRAYQILCSRLPEVECMLGDGSGSCVSTGDVVTDLLGIAAIRPLRKDTLTEFLIRYDAPWDTVTDLIRAGELAKVKYEGEVFYLRKLKKVRRSRAR